MACQLNSTNGSVLVENAANGGCSCFDHNMILALEHCCCKRVNSDGLCHDDTPVILLILDKKLAIHDCLSLDWKAGNNERAFLLHFQLKPLHGLKSPEP